MKLQSKEVFDSYMRYRELTNKELARRVGCSTSMIARLRSMDDPKDTVGTELGMRIEKELSVLKGQLFIPKIAPAPLGKTQPRAPKPANAA